MATAVTGPFVTAPAYSQTFIPSVWSGKLNVKFYATTVFGDISNTAYEGEIKNQGDKVIINNIPSLTIRDYAVGQSLNYEVPAPSTIELTIDQAKYFGVNVSDVLDYQSKPNLMAMFTDDASKQMAITIDRTLLLQCYNTGSAANKGATAGAISGSFNLGTDNAPVTMTANNVLTLITSMSSVLDEQNVPDADRWLLITPYVRQLLMSSPLGQAYVTGDSQSILRNGKIGMIDRFTLYVSNLLPSAAAGFAFDGTVQGGAAKRTAILAGQKSALTFASQIAKVETLQNPTDFGNLVRGLNVYGYKTIKPESLVLALVN
jgi:N4-gp56 family major capsid protein